MGGPNALLSNMWKTWEAQMLCWLASGEHEALKGDTKRVWIVIPAWGIPTFTPRLYPTERRKIIPRQKQAKIV